MSLLAVQGGATGTGTVTILAPSTSTNRTLTLPDATGTVALQGGAGVGKVLQVVSVTYSTQVTTTSSSFVTTGLTASITPTSATSKILVIASMPMISSTSSQNARATVFRNGSNVAPNTNLGVLQGNGAAQFATVPITLLDSPATTSSTTYAIYGASSSGTAYFNDLPGIASSSVITLMEIAA